MCLVNEEALHAAETAPATVTPHKRWRIRQRGAIVREGKELTSQFLYELEAGTVVEALVQLHWTAKGVTRVQLTYPVQGWVSLKVLLDCEQIGLKVETTSARESDRARRSSSKDDPRTPTSITGGSDCWSFDIVPDSDELKERLEIATAEVKSLRRALLEAQGGEMPPLEDELTSQDDNHTSTVEPATTGDCVADDAENTPGRANAAEQVEPIAEERGRRRRPRSLSELHRVPSAVALEPPTPRSINSEHSFEVLPDADDLVLRLEVAEAEVRLLTEQLDESRCNSGAASGVEESKPLESTTEERTGAEESESNIAAD